MTPTKLPLVGWLKFLNWIELNLFEEKGEPKRYRTEVLPLTSLTPYARPDRLTTGSPQSWTCHIVRSMLTSSAKLCPQSPGPPLSFVLLATTESAAGFNTKQLSLAILSLIVQELCESRSGMHPGLSVLTSLLVSVDVKLSWPMLRH